MKNVNTRTLALSVLLGGSLAAFGGTKVAKAPPPEGTNYILRAVITTNPPPPEIVTAVGVPIMPDLAGTNLDGVVSTSAGGLIQGVYDMVYTNLTLCSSTFTEGDFISDIVGSISTVGIKTNILVVNMTMKGNGYVQDSNGSTQRLASINLSFTSKGGLIASNSVVTITGTNPVIVLDPVAGFGFLTNNGIVYDVDSVYTFQSTTNYSTNIVQHGAYEELVVSYGYDTFGIFTNSGATNVVSVDYTNCSDECSVLFGEPGTNAGGFSFVCFGTNIFTNYVIATNYTIIGNQFGTNLVYNVFTNYVYGLSTNDLAAWLAATTNGITTNGTDIVRFVTSIVTNSLGGTSTTNINVVGGYVGLPVFSNGWFEVDGTLKGGIAAGKCVQSFKGDAASLSQSYELFGTFTGTGSISNTPYFGANTNTGVWLATNDLGVIYVFSSNVVNSSLSLRSLSDSTFSGTIKQFGAAIWASTYEGFIGAGTNNFKKDRYAMTLTGLGQARGVSLVVTGANGLFINGYSAGSNVVTYTNTAGGSNATFIASASNTNLYAIDAGLILSSTNGIGSTNLTVTNFFVCGEIPPLIITNSIDCIITGLAKGKIFGQRISVGFTNADQLVPTNSP